jgi:hypothetical protein
MTWAVPQYSKQQVNAAGRVVASTLDDGFRGFEGDDYDKYDAAVGIINNWRSSHGYPLNTFQVNLRRSARRIDQNALVAQRTKRLYSIALKLYRFPKMKLTQMQDVGGCRAVVASAEDVGGLRDYYMEESQIKHKLSACDDYIETPRLSGYRGVHLVYRYFSDRERPAIYNDMKIEIQLRSQYQHAWATAVETVGTFVREALKSSMGPEEWLRFFALMGSIIAIREDKPPVPGTPNDRKELVVELGHHANELRVAQRLRAYSDALRKIEGETRNAFFYLLQLDPLESQPRLTITGFRLSEAEEATRRYSDAERLVRQQPGTDAVLVSVDSLAALPRAYPNYFADTRVFLELLSQALSGQQRRIQTKAIRLGS